jgi:uncharacterized OB-fold protein
LSDYKKPIPRPTPETQDFWEGCKAGELRLQKCNACSKVYFPPRPFCPACSSRDVASFKSSGKGTLHSYVINHRPSPGFEAEAPYAIAIVLTDEGTKHMTNIVGIENTPENLKINMPLEVVFEPITDTISLPKWKPAGS